MDEAIKNITSYIDRAFTGIKPFLGLIFSWIGYIIFPEKVYFLSLMAVLGASFLDIITKSISICKIHGGYKNAIKEKKLFSKSLWKGTQIKIISYLFISILTGLSYRVIYLKEAGILLASFVYSVMFMREFQSNVENLIEAGADLHWLLLFSRKKNKELMKPYEEDEKDKPKKDSNEEDYNKYL
ncbi:hypothetical protein DW1_1155 [Proteiniborus sp. DW1]|uniref:hypothetical protein n=1 Tax=Proteiniborus sp. DW1 TaxID=1889883 RepID=UPI00092E114A|nr:hypothetical protein [Proteiniborus sp. DW1]SCG82728.1 hypothetical protein DW1_1155 [Proteiniborus sp. DW1]